jgi:RHH-type proline utilization regulon transcriptional repressor/proline dehydrogenase/delta 1-pyrroline-5-carboxylate dehydrogenase
LASRDVFEPVFATHNLRTQARVMAWADAIGVAPETLEFQMLYGMGEPIKAVLVGQGYRVREYVPVGPLANGLGYAGRRFRELASPDNALSRSLHGDLSTLTVEPHFVGEQDQADGSRTLALRPVRIPMAE